MSGTIPATFVTLAQARAQLRSDTDVDDALVTQYIRVASSQVVRFIDRGMMAFQDSSGAFVSPFVDSGGNFIPPDDLQAAVLLLVGYLYNQRDEDSTSEFADGRLPRPVRALLATYRGLVT